MRNRIHINESSSVDDDDDDDGGDGDGADQGATDVVELRPDDKEDTDKTPENI